MRAVFLVSMLLVVGGAGPAGAQEVKKSEPERLFRDREPLELTLRAPFGAIFKNRDTTKANPLPGSFEYVDAKLGKKSVAVTLDTRGHFRLRRMTCGFAPLKVEFDKESAKGTVFSGQGGIKLVTHCQNANRNEQNLLIEEATYRMYNLLTPFSHRTRLAKITYVPEDTTKAVTRYGFFIEDDKELAKRNGTILVMATGGNFSDMESGPLDLAMLFEYMIGNTDWSVAMIHNFRILDRGKGEAYIPVAYDFDFSGLVGASYAVPDERLPIKSVKERLYRGPCRKIEELIPMIERFSQAKDSLYAVIQGMPGLEPKRAKEATEYLDGFFSDVKRPKDFNGSLGYACRGR